MRFIKSFKAKLLTGVMTTLVMVGLQVGTAGAWNYAISGNGVCQADGSFKITWTVDNSHEKDALRILNSSNTAVVPVKTKVPAGQTANFNQTADGTKPGAFSLTLTANWKGDNRGRTRTGEVILDKACPQPPKVLATSTVTPQVKAPVGAVAAGEGGAESTNLGAAIGSLASFAVVGVGLGLRRFGKYDV